MVTGTSLGEAKAVFLLEDKVGQSRTSRTKKDTLSRQDNEGTIGWNQETSSSCETDIS